MLLCRGCDNASHCQHVLLATRLQFLQKIN